MKTKLMKLFLVAFIFTVTITSVSANTFIDTNQLNQNMQKPDLTDEVFETKEFNESRAKYLKEVYGENWKELYTRNANSVENAKKIESEFPKDLKGNPIYPEYIGGLYINDDDYLVIQVVNKKISKSKTSQNTLYQKVLSVDKNAIVESVNYSFSEMTVINEMLENLFLENKLPSSVMAFYIDVINNKIVVELSICSEQEKLEFKNSVIDSPIITFKKGKETTVTLNAGAPNGAGGSVGYRARKGSSGQGFVTHGHGMTVNSVITGIGKVKNKRFGGNIDASWVDTNGYSATPTNNWHAYPPYTIPTLSLSTVVKDSFFVGERVGRIGSASGHRTGKITKASYSTSVKECETCSSVNFTKMVLTDVYQTFGDSGGIVYYTLKAPITMPFPDGSTEAHLTAGIGVFKTSDNKMVFSRADLINSAFGLSRY